MAFLLVSLFLVLVLALLLAGVLFQIVFRRLDDHGKQLGGLWLTFKDQGNRMEQGISLAASVKQGQEYAAGGTVPARALRPNLNPAGAAEAVDDLPASWNP